MRIGAFVLAIALPYVACAQQTPRPYERPLRQAVRGARGALATGSEHASDAGLRMYHAGGNAVDAGIASMFAAATFEFSHFGFGGEVPILIRTKEGKVVSIAGVGTMPKSASPEFFRQRRLLPGEVQEIEPNGLRNFVPVAGVVPALVPGMMDAGLLALRDYGTKSFSEVIQPAIELTMGVPLDEMRAGSIAYMRRFAERWPSTKTTFLPLGRPPGLGEIFRQPNLERTLRLLVAAEEKARKAGKTRAQSIDAVRDAFYRGDIARRIAAFSKDNGGLLTYEDLAAFRADVEEPLAITYRGLTVYKPGFWTQGPSTLQALNILEHVELKPLGFNSGAYLHTLIEAMKLAYADRDTYYGDPKFAKVPVAKLLAKDYALERRKLIGQRASKDYRPGTIAGVRSLHPSDADVARVRVDEWLKQGDTTCVNAIDKDGVAFSATPSGSSLPAVVAGDTGITLTTRAQSFYLIAGHPNELAGGKRPRVTLSPTLVLRDGKPYLALSTPGGDNQDQALLQIMLNVVEFGMDAQRAVEAPRFQTKHLVSSFDNHAMGTNELILDERITREAVADLTSRGHVIEVTSRWNSGAAPVALRVLLNGVIEAGADPYAGRSARAW
ncbi:MAG: gamma-glutamyltransferase family protein [Bryobacteraceae bacterium]|nr:gamma-glutamyltransferase family protein [Bryobacteraceae bacterium]